MKLSLDIPVKKFYSIHANIGGDSKVEYTIQLISLNKGKMSRKVILDSSEVDNFKKVLRREHPVVLTITGKGVLSKFITPPKEVTDQKVLDAVLANAGTDDFQIQYFPCGDQLACTAMRNSIVDEVLNVLPGQNIVIALYVGDLAVLSLGYLMKEYVDHQIEKYVVRIEEGRIVHVEKNDVTQQYLAIGEEQITVSELGCFSGAFNFISNPLDIALGSRDQIQVNRNTQQDKYLYNYMRIGLAAILFIGLLLNEYYSSTYADRIAALRTGQADLIARSEVKKRLESTLESKSSFLELSGMHSRYQVSRYTDILAQSVPASIKLTELLFSPSLKSFSKKKKPEFKEGCIVVRGQSDNTMIVNQWVTELHGSPWVNNVVLTDYQKNKKQQYDEFEIEIIVNAGLE